MPPLVLARWLAREWPRNRWAWLLGSAALLMGPLTWLASPIGITTDGLSSGFYIASIWFLSSYCGALVGLIILCRAGRIWDELTALAQTSLAWLVILALGMIHASLAVAPYCWLAEGASANAWGGLLCISHWAALAAFLQRAPLGFPARCIGLTLLGWWIPALLAGAEGWQRVAWILGPARHLEVAGPPTDISLGVLADTIPIVAWWVATALLPTRSAFRR